MNKNPRRTPLVLLSFTFIALFSGFFLKGLLITDVRQYLADDRNERLHVISADSEAAFMKRIDKRIMAWSFLTTGLALGMGLFLSRKPALQTGKPEQAPASAGTTEQEASLPKPGNSEAADAENPGDAPDAGMSAPGPLPSPALHGDEQAAADDDFDGDDAEMQPLADEPDRIKKIVHGLEELSKAELSGSALRKEPLELEPYLQGVVEKVRPAYREKEVRFEIECGKGLRLSTDPDCLTLILVNLVDNAAKAVKEAGSVTVSAAAKEDQVVFSVRDTGTGIRRNHLPHIFERFFRGAGSGIGLGLTIVKVLVDACGGRIEVRSERGKGSVFTVFIPSA